jgi:hypothetical protein
MNGNVPLCKASGSLVIILIDAWNNKVNEATQKSTILLAKFVNTGSDWRQNDDFLEAIGRRLAG